MLPIDLDFNVGAWKFVWQFCEIHYNKRLRSTFSGEPRVLPKRNSFHNPNNVLVWAAVVNSVLFSFPETWRGDGRGIFNLIFNLTFLQNKHSTYKLITQRDLGQSHWEQHTAE